MRASSLVAMASLLVVLLTGCGGGAQPEVADTETSAEADPAATQERDSAPAIEGTTLDGERISLARLRGRPVLVNVWSSW